MSDVIALKAQIAVVQAALAEQQQAALAALAAQQAAQVALAEQQQAAQAALAEQQQAAQAALAKKEAQLMSTSAALAVALAGNAAQPPPLALRGSIFPGITAALASGPGWSVIESPSKSTESLVGSFAALAFGARPLTPALVRLSAADSLAAWSNRTAEELLREESAHPVATSYVPAWVEAITRSATATQSSRSAASLYLGRASGTATPAVPGVQVPWNCLPKLLTCPRKLFHPAYCGEIKSAFSKGDFMERPQMYDELTTYALLAMLGSYFQGVPPHHHRFFHAPPLAFGLAAFAHVGYLVCMEWVGKVRTTVVSQPFFLGSPEHAAAVAALPSSDFSEDFVDLPVDGVGVAAWPFGEVSKHVLWRVGPPPQGQAAEGGGARSGGGSSSSSSSSSKWSSRGVGSGGAEPPLASDPRFFKILRSKGFSEDAFSHLFAVYSVLAVAFGSSSSDGGGGGSGSDPPPSALLPAQLLYGAGEVCVLMPWAQGREAVEGDFESGGHAVEPVAQAIAWLARRGLLYIDVRLPNVLVEEEEGAAPRVHLVDYDDVVVLEEPVASADALCALLRTHSAFAQLGAFPALMEALEAQPWL